MTLQQFIDKYNGIGVDTDQAYGFQCMDLMHRYVVDVLGLDLALFAAPTAYQAYQGANDPRFDKIDNTPTGVPQPGDIMFWDTTIGSAGHVAIFISGDASNFKSLDQNWPTGSLTHIQDHTYNGVAGWLHPKSAPQQVDQTTVDELRKSRDDNWNLYQAELQKNTDLTKQFQDEQIKSQQLREANDKITQADAETGVQLLDAQHALKSATDVLQSHYKAVGVANEQDYQNKLKALTGPQVAHDKVVIKTQDQLAEAAIYKKVRKQSQGFITTLKDFFHI